MGDWLSSDSRRDCREDCSPIGRRFDSASAVSPDRMGLSGFEGGNTMIKRLDTFDYAVMAMTGLFVFVFLSPFWLMIARLIFEYAFHGGVHDCEIDAINHYYR